MAAQLPVDEALQQLNSSTWLLGGKMVLSCLSQRIPDVPSWCDSNGRFFHISAQQDVQTPCEQISNTTCTIPLVHYVGEAHAVWKVGAAYLKVIIPATPFITREHVTLKALREQQCSFAIPHVLYHGEWDGRYYLIVTEVPGITLARAWPSMDETSRNECVAITTQVCKEVASLMGSGNEITGIDGNHLAEYFLGNRTGKQWDFRPEVMKESSLDQGLDCSALVFYPCDMGPGNILVDSGPTGLSIGVIDWECAGFVPKSWVHMKFYLAGGMDFSLPQESSREARQAWRVRMEESLEQAGL